MTVEEMFEHLTPGNKELVIAAIDELLQQQDGNAEAGAAYGDKERYPNFAKLTALLNQEKHPRRALNELVNLLVFAGWKSEGGAQHDTRKPD